MRYKIQKETLDPTCQFGCKTVHILRLPLNKVAKSGYSWSRLMTCSMSFPALILVSCVLLGGIVLVISQVSSQCGYKEERKKKKKRQMWKRVQLVQHLGERDFLWHDFPAVQIMLNGLHEMDATFSVSPSCGSVNIVKNSAHVKLHFWLLRLFDPWILTFSSTIYLDANLVLRWIQCAIGKRSFQGTSAVS